MKDIINKLSAPFSASDVDWKIQTTGNNNTRGLVVPYIDSRAIQNRLDDVVGPFNWRTQYRPWHQISRKGKNGTEGETIYSQLCGLSIYCEERAEWIEKWDAAENSDYEPVKGGISDSFKRAAVLWGIGRFLYSMEGVWVDIEEKGRSFAIKKSALPDLDKEYARMLKAFESGTAPTTSGDNETPPPAKKERAPKPSSSARASVPAPETNVIEFDYAVKSAEVKKFGSGNGTVLELQNKGGESVVAIMKGENPEIAAGICLKDVKLSSHTGNNDIKYNTLDAYRIVA